MKMNFYSTKYDFKKWHPPSDIQYPAIVLYKDSWDDFNYKTMYNVRFFKDSTESERIGFLKILHRKDIVTILPEKFDKLSDDYCSLGTIDYYCKMKKCFKNASKNLLEKLSDCAINEEIKNKFADSEGFKDSLLRHASSEKALEEGSNIINGLSSEFNSRFSFDCEIGNFKNKHSIFFNFEKGKSEFLPYRIICLIGKNGSGKTQYLSKLALGMSGEKPELKKGFDPGRPLFSQVIAISYSIFDSFEKPSLKISSKDQNEGEKFSYVYCGFKRADDSILSYEEIQVQLYESIVKIIEIGKIKDWSESLTPVFDENVLLNLINEIKINEKIYEIFIDDLLENLDEKMNIKIYNESIKNIFKKIVDVTNFLHLSSGQSTILNFATNLYSNIRKETLVIYDEPETHLHPNGIYQLISILYDILNKTNSYAIIATHSPIIIQQIPSKYVRIFTQLDNYIEIQQPSLETFGENLTALTNEIFGNNMHDEYYKKILEKIVDKPTVFQREITIDDLFEGDLSLNARIFYEGKKNETKHH